jgi:predicted ATPase/DNA-binding CsgD family transcriptional regulator
VTGTVVNSAISGTTSGSRRRSGNLAAEVDGFVGRTDQVKEVRSLLSASRLVTLVGVGGVGKTRFALRLAHTVSSSFADGVWFVELADLPVDAGLPLLHQTIAGAFELSDFSSKGLREALTDYLRPRHCLLILDNCEHIADETAMFATALLRTAPELRIVVTSRRVLHCAGEYVFNLPPLTVRTPGDAERESGGEAAELLYQRATAMEASLGSSDTADAEELCRRLDGIPLAIELAAGRLNSLTVQQVLDRIDRVDDRFDVLTSDVDRGRPIHQTLRQVMDWSFQLCTESERLLWKRISVFTGTFDLAAAEHVCAGEGLAADDILDAVTGLIRQSVLVVDHGGPIARYRLLETLRQYGLQELAQHGAEIKFRQRHHDYYRGLSARALLDKLTPREIQWLIWAYMEMPNLRAALSHGITTGYAEQSLELAVNLSRIGIWHFSGWLAEGRTWLERALTSSEQRDDTDATSPQTSPLRIAAMSFTGWISLCQGDIAAAKQAMEDCHLAIRGEEDVPSSLSFLDGAYALLAENDARSIPVLQAAIYSRENSTEPSIDTPVMDLLLAMSACFVGDHDTAVEITEKYLHDALQHDRIWQIAWGQLVVAVAQMKHGDCHRALAYARDSVGRYRDMGDRWSTVWSAHGVAWALAARLRTSSDTHNIQAARDIARVLGAAQRLRDWHGVGLDGIKPAHVTTIEAEHTAKAVLDEQTYQQAFEAGSLPGVDPAVDYHRILDQVVGEETTPPATPDLPPTGEDQIDQLTRRERAVAILVAEGLTNPEISRQLIVSERTVQSHVGSILRKLSLRNRQELAVWQTLQDQA